MEMRGLLQTEIILDIWNILIIVGGDIVTDAGSLLTKNVISRD
jgi:hypothetical protein